MEDHPSSGYRDPEALNCPKLSCAVLFYGGELNMCVITTAEEDDEKEKREDLASLVRLS